jgi:hypothetical protein
LSITATVEFCETLTPPRWRGVRWRAAAGRLG